MYLVYENGMNIGRFRKALDAYNMQLRKVGRLVRDVRLVNKKRNTVTVWGSR